jgi:hypothetical protein
LWYKTAERRGRRRRGQEVDRYIGVAQHLKKEIDWPILKFNQSESLYYRTNSNPKRLRAVARKNSSSP